MGRLWLRCVTFNPFKKRQRRGDARHALGQAFPSLLSSGEVSCALAGVPKRGKGLRGLLKLPSFPARATAQTCSPPLRSLGMLDKRASYCYADDALLPISRLIVQLIRQLGDSCRDGFVECSVLPLIYVTCSNYHLHSSVQQ